MKVIITGSSGMVGKAALLKCIESNEVKEILVINRTSINPSHPKVKELILSDFSEIATLKNELIGYDACFYCMGISAAGLGEQKYSWITYEMTKRLADTLHESSPNAVFIYVSGQGTDSTEKGRIMWARVKGKTENYILNKGFKDAYAFRPGIILPDNGIKSRTRLYNIGYIIARPFFSILRRKSWVITSTKLALSMIKLVGNPIKKKHLENVDFNELINK